jgi:hypothetical protein
MQTFAVFLFDMSPFAVFAKLAFARMSFLLSKLENSHSLNLRWLNLRSFTLPSLNLHLLNLHASCQPLLKTQTEQPSKSVQQIVICYFNLEVYNSHVDEEPSLDKMLILLLFVIILNL